MRRHAPLRRTTQLRQVGRLDRSSKLRAAPLTSRGNAKTRAGQRRLAEAKADVHGRSGGFCEAGSPVCPEGRHLAHHVHHVLPRGQGGKHDPENLLDVCHPAHDWIHSNPADAYAAGLLRHREVS